MTKHDLVTYTLSCQVFWNAAPWSCCLSSFYTQYPGHTLRHSDSLFYNIMQRMPPSRAPYPKACCCGRDHSRRENLLIFEYELWGHLTTMAQKKILYHIRFIPLHSVLPLVPEQFEVMSSKKPRLQVTKPRARASTLMYGPSCSARYPGEWAANPLKFRKPRTRNRSFFPLLVSHPQFEKKNLALSRLSAT